MPVFTKGNRLNSILPIRCPHCHKGKFLVHPLSQIFKITRVREQCDHCGVVFKIEPSFYYGSMYIAYALGVAIMGIVSILYWMLAPNFSVLACFTWVVFSLIATSPFLNGYAKIIWANFFIAYEPETADQNTND
ncbi:MAG: DUF983 domain-containing protein [Bacteroidetes bacterium]|nr:DUF983 domain-containing protein [Bacteroidota bacterium]MDA1345453.1 DUF983 domain-containing protein [Bacteroidota bacterium]